MKKFAKKWIIGVGIAALVDLLLHEFRAFDAIYFTDEFSMFLSGVVVSGFTIWLILLLIAKFTGNNTNDEKK